MNNNKDTNIGSIIQNNILLVGLCIFVVVYIIINYNKVKEGIINNVDIGNTILITLITALVLYLLTMDENDKKDEINIPKFKLSNVNAMNGVNEIKNGLKYRIVNSINDLDNHNIFISQKNIGKYGIKF